MTSNLGSNIIQETFDENVANDLDKTAEKAKILVNELLRKTIRPEFINRIDEIVLFRPLTKMDLRNIVNIQFEQLKVILLEKGIKLHIKEEAFDWICETGFDAHFGARPVKRVIQKQVLNELSKAILSQKIDVNQTVVMDIFDGKIVFRKAITEEEEVY